MTVLVATDLDRTLVYSAAALGLAEAGISDEAAPPLHVVEVYRGAPLSFLTAAAADALRATAAAATLVPATTRTRAQYARVQLPGLRPRWAVTTNGAHLLHDGVTDEDWTLAVRARLGREGVPLTDVSDHLGQVAGPFVLRSLLAEDVFAYLVVDRALLPSGWLEELTAWCAARGWRVSLQGRKVYCVPVGLAKSAAVAEVARREGCSRIVAGGDSLLDAELLDAADAAVRPAHGELHAVGWTAPHLHVTERAGVLGGQDVALWYRAQVIDP